MTTTMNRADALATTDPYTLGRLAERHAPETLGAAHAEAALDALQALAERRPRALALAANALHALLTHAWPCPYEPESAEAQSYGRGQADELAWMRAHAEPVSAREARFDDLEALAGMISVSPVGRERAWSGAVPEGFSPAGDKGRESDADASASLHGVARRYVLASADAQALRESPWPVWVALDGTAEAFQFPALYSLITSTLDREYDGEIRPRGSMVQRTYSGGAAASRMRTLRAERRADADSHALAPTVTSALERGRVGTSER